MHFALRNNTDDFPFLYCFFHLQLEITDLRWILATSNPSKKVDLDVEKIQIIYKIKWN